MTARDELAEVVAEDQACGSCSTEGHHCGECLRTADAILAAGYRKPRIITTPEELDAVEDETLLLASGKYLDGNGTFADCWIRPIPDHITGGTGQRLFEALIYLDGGVHNMTRSECITYPVTVLWEPGAR